MKILAFETSCDDTGVAIIENGTKILANVRHSQVEHSVWGGVVPEIAARLHSEKWIAVLEKCLKDAGCSIEDIDEFAVTAGPGLQTSLLVGTTATSFLSLFYKKKLIPVHHILGHISSVVLGRELSEFSFPFLTLVASGGHTDFYIGQSFSDLTRVGQTIDDAAGEAFDKVAKLLGLGYPGGPIVSDRAEKGDPKKYKLPQPMLEKDSLNFSFSGVKAAVYRLVQGRDCVASLGMTEEFIADVCASFEQTVVDIFLKKLDRALDKYPDTKAIHFVGGVSANKRLREEIDKFCQLNNVQFMTTQKIEYSTDNAAMIGAAAYFQYEKNSKIAKTQFVDANPQLVF